MIFRFRSLTQRFAVLFALVAAILVGVSIVVTVHLRNIRIDSKRLLEEAREQTITARLISEIDSLSALLLTTPDPEELHRARELLRSSRSELAEMEGDHDDPSRQEHQRTEMRIADRLDEGLLTVDQLLSSGAGSEAEEEALAILEKSRHYADVLHEEALEESLEANRDLQHRARLTRLSLALTWVFSLLLLGVALITTQRGVVQPLRQLRDGTERFGRGELGHRVDVENTDEIGDLAESFNEMAARLARAQDELEERVRRRTQEFIRAARLADLGVLASGIAHEINTPLASIASSAEGLERKATSGDLPMELLRDYSRTISQEAFRAREITTRMLDLVRQEPSTVASVGLAPVVHQAEVALRHRAERRGVELVTSPVREDAHVRANAGELVQILVNLLANAIDASSPGDRIDLEAEVLDGEIRLVVRDQGEGIADDDLERIFEPFFTTKSPGQGTGLGLALVATMVEYHGGTVSVESRRGAGSTFRVHLPASWSGKE